MGEGGQAVGPAIGFVLEQTLGHVTHAQNLRDIVGDDPSVRAHWMLVPFDVEGWPARVPLWGNWTVRAGVRARRALREVRGREHLDAVFVHTQVPAVLLAGLFDRLPAVVSIDATPEQYDSLGEHYAHERSREPVERVKWRLNRRCFAKAAHLVSWSAWGKHGLVDRYEVPADKVSVIPPGVWFRAWAQERPVAAPTDAVRFLFVGGHFERKGGPELLDAFRTVRAELAGRPGGPAELHLDVVTASDVAEEPGVSVHRGLQPNSAPLKARYRAADVFCLPTRGDCLPMVLSEAGAAGLPLVSTDVGAIGEIVRPGATGFLGPVGDVGALAAALRALALDPSLRHRLGAQAHDLVRREFDAEANAHRLVGLLADVAARRPVTR